MKLKVFNPDAARDMLYSKKATIFDLDGVLVEPTEKIWVKAYVEALRSYGINPRPTLLLDFIKANKDARNAPDFWKTIIGELNKVHGLPESELKYTLYRLNKSAEPDLGRLELRDNAIELCHDLLESGQSIGLATTSTRRTVDIISEANPEFAEAFGGNIVTATDIGPKVKAYGKMIEELEETPNEVTAIDDTRGGLQSARGAGIDDVIAYINPGISNLKVKKETPFQIESLGQLRR